MILVPNREAVLEAQRAEASLREAVKAEASGEGEAPTEKKKLSGSE